MNIYRTNLYFFCRAISPQSNNETADFLRACLRRGDVIWECLMDIAGTQMLVPALYINFLHKKMENQLPIEKLCFLRKIYELNCKRNEKLRFQILEAIVALNKRGIRPMLFKGATHLFEAIHEDPGIRMMSDLDILVPSEQLAVAVRTLLDIGYREVHKNRYTDHHHWAPMIRDNIYAPIELHRHVLSRSAAHAVTARTLLDSACLFEVHNACFLIPTPTFAVLLNIISSQIINRNYYYKRFDLRSQYDFAAMMLQFSSLIDWKLIRSVMAECGWTTALTTYLLGCRYLFNIKIPFPNEYRYLAPINYMLSLMVFQWRFAEVLLKKFDSLRRYTKIR